MAHPAELLFLPFEYGLLYFADVIQDPSRHPVGSLVVFPLLLAGAIVYEIVSFPGRMIKDRRKRKEKEQLEREAREREEEAIEKERKRMEYLQVK